MLLEYEVSNFTVFRDKTTLSMKPGKVYRRFSDNVYKAHSKMKVSKFALIVGENGSGKTYFMTSLDFLKYLMTSYENVRSIKNLCSNYNFEQPQSFKLVVLIDKKIYTYELTIDQYSIVSEELKYRGYTQKEQEDISIFSNRRTKTEEYNYGIGFSYQVKSYYNFKKDFQKMLETNPGRLLLNALSIFGIKEVNTFLNWIERQLVIILPSNATLNIYRQMEKSEEDLRIIQNDNFLEIFRLADPTIIRLKIDLEDPFRESILTRRREEKEFDIPIKYESSGIREFFAWSIQIWKVIYENVTLFADELDRVLNPILASKVLQFIKGSEHCGQFIFSTHNIFHLNTRDFTKEQLYFVNKNPETLESELYSLAEFKDYRYEKENVYELYLKGLLGGVPNE